MRVFRCVLHVGSRPGVAIALLAALLTAGCGGGGMDTGSADPVVADDPLDWTQAALWPARDLLDLALSVARFAGGPASNLIARGAATAETLLVLPDRPGSFFLAWFDADRDGGLSSGDGLRLDFGYAPGNGRLVRATGRGVHLPELLRAAGGVQAPSVFVDLPAADADAAALTGTFGLAFAADALGEHLAVSRGPSPVRWSAGEAAALLDTLDLALDLQPWAGTWLLRGRLVLRDCRLGPLTCEIGTPLAGRIATGLLGPLDSGSLVLRRALGGTLRLLVTAPRTVHLSLDFDDDGVFDRVEETAWPAPLDEDR